MAECSGSSYYNSLKSGKTSVQWFFSYWWPILEWKQGKFQLWNDSLTAHRLRTHLHLCMYLMSGQRVTMISELNFALSSSSIRERPLHSAIVIDFFANQRCGQSGRARWRALWCWEVWCIAAAMYRTTHAHSDWHMSSQWLSLFSLLPNFITVNQSIIIIISVKFKLI